MCPAKPLPGAARAGGAQALLAVLSADRGEGRRFMFFFFFDFNFFYFFGLKKKKQTIAALAVGSPLFTLCISPIFSLLPMSLCASNPLYIPQSFEKVGVAFFFFTFFTHIFAF